LQRKAMVHAMDLRIRAVEVRAEVARLERLAAAARNRASDRCRDQRAEEQALLVRAAEAEARARRLEAAGRRQD